jgi:hypothetical protein
MKVNFVLIFELNKFFQHVEIFEEVVGE